MQEIIVDNFAGGGGASTGIEMATGRSVDVAINHDPSSIAMHTVNHPDTEHYCESVWDLHPRDVVKGRPVALCWLSPDCKHFSKAKGGKPKSKKIRGLAWIAVRWAATVKPRVIMLENVEEFKTWGPLLKDGSPDPDKKGHTFNSFKNALKRQGYKVETRELRACDYGAPTIRKRLFMIARCDGKPIKWPKPTHGDPESQEVMSGKLKPWRTATEIIDWSLDCPSIFERKKPLAENTQRRIARGIFKFVLNNPSPFIVRIGQTGFGGDKLQYELTKPLTTITTKAEHCLVSPTLIQTGYGENKGQKPRALDLHKPLGTVVAGGQKHALVTAFLSTYYTETTENGCRGQKLDEALHTITSGGNRFGLVATFLAKHYGGNYNGPGADINKPLPTVTTVDHNALVTAFIARHFKSSIGHSLDQPSETLTTVNKSSLVAVFLLKYYGADIGQNLSNPLHTVTTKDRFGLVTVEGEDYHIVDIGMRMLQPHELYGAQGFPENYIIDKDHKGNPITKTDQVARCGNAVPPPFAEHLVRANLSEICTGSGKELAFERYKESVGQLEFSM
jgi:DNA (cytosine-5)-methyltransferase 1